MKYKWPDETELMYDSQQVALYKTRGDSPQLVVVDAASLAGLPLSEFLTVQETVLDKDPEWAPKIAPANKDETSWRYSSYQGVITKIRSNYPDDTIRAVYVNFQDNPVLLATSRSREFRDLDTGNLLSVRSEGDFEVERTVTSRNNLERYFPALDKKIDEDALQYVQGLAKIRKNILDHLMTGKMKSGYIGGYLVDHDSCSISYSDTTIVVPGPSLGNVLTYVNEHCGKTRHQFTDMLKGIAKGPCLGVSVQVNGTSMRLELRPSSNGADLRYMNGKKIAQPDVDAVIDSVICYPGQQEAYDDFLTTVSKVSMKFHKACANGIIWNLGAGYCADGREMAESGGSDARGHLMVDVGGGKMMRLPAFMQEDSDDAYSCVVMVRKTPGKRCQANIMGKWRGIQDFDVFSRFMTDKSSNSWKVNRSLREGLEFEGPEGKGQKLYARPQEADMVRGPDGKLRVSLTTAPRLTGEDRNFIRLLARLDECLSPEDRILPATAYRRASDPDRPGRGDVRMFADNADSRTAVVEARAALVEMFQNSRNLKIDRLVKSRALLDEIIAETGAREVCDDGEWRFEVTGVSGTTYRVDERTAAVSDLAGQHICIVRASSKFETAGYDYIASLLAVLRDDRFTARDIHTLRGRVGIGAAA